MSNASEYDLVNNHVGYLNNIEALDLAKDFCKEMVCTGTSDCGSVIIGGGNSISEVQRNSLILYPNPVIDILNFRTDFNGVATVIDVTGRLVMEESFTMGKTRLDITDLKPGSYTLVAFGESISTAHFIKQ